MAIGLSQIAEVASVTNPDLPSVSTLADGSRQSNKSDEYALMLARYGQPSKVSVTQKGSVPIRTATYAGAQVSIISVPAGCVDAYSFLKTHQNGPAGAPKSKRQSRANRKAEPTSPACIQAVDNASTLVAYGDGSGNEIDAATAQRSLEAVSATSDIPPTVQRAEPSPANKQAAKSFTSLPMIAYSQDTLANEQRRLADLKTSGRTSKKTGSLLLAGSLLFLVPGVFVHRKNKESRLTRLVYDLSQSATEQHQAMEEALDQLGRSDKLWRLDSQSAISDWKRNAGAAYNVKRESINMRKSVPPRIESNITPISMDLGTIRMFFFPDQVLYWQGGTFASIEYKDLMFGAGSTRFIEEQRQTSDSLQVGSTWRYVRKDGGPDRRFNNNKELPVMQYGIVTANSRGGLNLVLHTSSLNAASAFTTSFKAMQSVRNTLKLDETSDPNAKAVIGVAGTASRFPADIQHAMELLGVDGQSTLEEVNAAYRQKAQMYHPDKVVGLGPEFREMADERMRAVNAAQAALRHYLEQA